MAISFNQNSVFNLKPMDIGKVREEVHGLCGAVPGFGIVYHVFRHLYGEI